MGGVIWEISVKGAMGGRRFVAALLFAALVLAGEAAPAAAETADEDTALGKAIMLLQRGYVFHVFGAYDEAIRHFKMSITAQPTAEAHTYLGWSLSYKGRYEDAIAECKRAIPLDPDFGNPYNDIGVYLTALGRRDEAVPWLKRAMRASRYCCYQFPHFNYGRILLEKGRMDAAEREFRRALDFDPDYLPAKKALRALKEHAPKL